MAGTETTTPDRLLIGASSAPMTMRNPKPGEMFLRTFANLPTVDHVIAEDGKVKFVICSWRVNDCKTHLSEDEFHSLCEQVLEYRARWHEKHGDNLSQLT